MKTEKLTLFKILKTFFFFTAKSRFPFQNLIRWSDASDAKKITNVLMKHSDKKDNLFYPQYWIDFEDRDSSEIMAMVFIGLCVLVIYMLLLFSILFFVYK